MHDKIIKNKVKINKQIKSQKIYLLNCNSLISGDGLLPLSIDEYTIGTLFFAMLLITQPTKYNRNIYKIDVMTNYVVS